MRKIISLILILSIFSIQSVFATDLIWSKNTKSNQVIIIKDWIDTRITDEKPLIKGKSKEQAINEYKYKEALKEQINFFNWTAANKKLLEDYKNSYKPSTNFYVITPIGLIEFKDDMIAK